MFFFWLAIRYSSLVTSMTNALLSDAMTTLLVPLPVIAPSILPIICLPSSMLKEMFSGLRP